MIIEGKEYLYKLSNSAVSPYQGANGYGFRKPVCYNVEKRIGIWCITNVMKPNGLSFILTIWTFLSNRFDKFLKRANIARIALWRQRLWHVKSCYFYTCVVNSKEFNLEITLLSTGPPPQINYSLQSTSRFVYRDPFQYLSGKGMEWSSLRSTRSEPAGPAIGISKWNTFRFVQTSSNIFCLFASVVKHTQC